MRTPSLTHHLPSFLVLGTLLLTGCGPQATSDDAPQYEVADASTAVESPASTSSSSRPSNDSAVELPVAGMAGYAPPQDADLDQLLEFVSELTQRQPQGQTREEMIADIVKINQGRLSAAEEIRKKDEHGELQVFAMKTELDSLRVLAAVGKDQDRIRFSDAVEAATKHSNPEIAKQGRLGSFQLQLDKVSLDNSGDLTEVTVALEKLIAEEEIDDEMVQTALELPSRLHSSGKSQDAARAVGVISAWLAKSEDARHQQIAKQLNSEAKMMLFESKFMALLKGEAGADEAVIEASQELATESEPTGQFFESFLEMAQQVESTGQIEIAKKMVEILRKRFADVEDEKLAAATTERLDLVQHRLDLMGAPLEVIGQYIDGIEFDQTDFEGKVVLLDFWATWCTYCIREFPNMKENYEKYHDKGFEIIGINLDDDPADAKKLLEKADLPWPTLIGRTPDEYGFANPMAERCGVTAIPFMLLIDQAGNVTAMHTRGPELGKRLAELLPD